MTNNNMTNKNRLRFAPSPTGFLHIGSLRTVLFNYLIAKKLEADFILRIEDTDEKRKVAGAVENLISILDWVGIQFDEGPHRGGNFGPYIQTERLDIYDKYKQELLDKGQAYHCFCTPERLDKMREDQQKKKLPPRYDRTCRDLSKAEVEKRIKAGETYVIRQKMPLEGEIKVMDELRGEIVFNAKEMDDQVLIKTSGVPTYQFASVVDDHLMEISHVTRSEEWIPSLPKNILLYQAFNWEPPKFIHYAGVLNKEGGKLSKRQGDVMVEDFRDKGYLPEAILNFCALLGWHPKDDEEVLSVAEILAKFEINDIRPSGAIFDIDKMDYFNGVYIRKMDLKTLVEMCKPYLRENLEKCQDDNKKTDEFLTKVISLEQERLKKLSDIAEAAEYFFMEEPSYEADLLIWKKLTPEQVKSNLEKVIELLEKIPQENWTDDSIEEALIDYIKAKEEKVGNYLWPMRVSLTGRKASPGPFEVAEVFGKSESLRRIKGGVGKL